MSLKKTFFLLLIACFSIFSPADAQIPSHYYDKALGKKGKELQKALSKIISDNYRTVYYGNTGATVSYTDPSTGVTYYPNCSEGDTCNNYKAVQLMDKLSKDSTFDIYSYPCCHISVVSGYGTETEGKQCQAYTFEHIFCQSWFSPNKSNGACEHNYNYPFATCSDMHHLFPTDHYINSTYHNNYPYGEVFAPIRISQNGTQMGYPNYENCDPLVKDKIVFEPADEFKGDVARALLYISVRYMNEDSLFATNEIINKSQFKPWALELLKKWHKMDPVSPKEVNRNNVIFSIQHNRNPFVDHPELVELIWGSDSLYDSFGHNGNYNSLRPILNKISWGNGKLVLEFQKKLEKSSAENVKNYLFSKGIYAESATCSNNTVTLTLKGTKYNTRYHLYIKNVKSDDGYFIKERDCHFVTGDHASYYNFCKGPRNVLAMWSFDENSCLDTSMVIAANTDEGAPAVFKKTKLYANGNYQSTKLEGSQLSLTKTTSNNVGDPRKAHSKGANSYTMQVKKGSANEVSLVFKTSTKSWKDIMVTFSNQRTSTGFKTGKWSWSLNGKDYTEAVTDNTLADFGNISASSNQWIHEVDLRQIDAIENKDSVFIRFTLSDAGSASGNNKLDNFVIYGEPIDYQEDVTFVEQISEPEFSIYPNPNNGDFTIEIGAESYFTHFQLFDMTGKQLQYQPISENKFNVNVKNLPSGIYFVRLSAGKEKNIIKKVVITK